MKLVTNIQNSSGWVGVTLLLTWFFAGLIV